MSTATRIYEIRNTDMLESHPPRLVEATSKTAALRHVYKPFEVSLPDTLRVLDLVNKQGVEVERAGDDEPASA